MTTDCLLKDKFNMKIPNSEHGENLLCTEIAFDIQNNFCMQYVLPMFCKKKSFWQRFTCISYILGFIMQSLVSFWSFQIKKNLNFPWKSSTLGKFKFPFWIKWLHASNFDYFFNTVIHTYSWREPEKFLNIDLIIRHKIDQFHQLNTFLKSWFFSCKSFKPVWRLTISDVTTYVEFL